MFVIWRIAILSGLVFLVAACDDDSDEAVTLLGGGPGSDFASSPAGVALQSDGTGTTTNTSLFGSVDNPATGGSGDPGTTGDWHTGAWGADIGDPNAQGVSLPPSVEAAAFGGNADNANGQMVQVTNLSTGQSAAFPIVDKGPGAKSVANGFGIDMLPASAAQIGATSGTSVQYKILPLSTNSFK
jgi:hypothetical protein